jgi:hypothetical protein
MNFSIFTMVPMLVLLHPRHVFIMFRSNNVYKCFNRSTTAGASSSKPADWGLLVHIFNLQNLKFGLRPPAHQIMPHGTLKFQIAFWALRPTSTKTSWFKPLQYRLLWEHLYSLILQFNISVICQTTIKTLCFHPF